MKKTTDTQLSLLRPAFGYVPADPVAAIDCDHWYECTACKL